MNNNIQTFTLLPPFYDESPHSSPKPLIRSIEDEFGITVKNYSWKRSSFDFDVIIVNKSIVFRFPRTEEVRARLPYEIKLLAFLKGKKLVALPEYKYVSKAKDFAGYKIVSGSVLRKPGFRRLSRNNKDQVASKLVNFINYYHGIPLKDFKKFRPRTKLDFVKDERRIARELKKTLYPCLSKKEVDTIQSHYKDARQLLKTQQEQCPLHGDLYSENIIWDKTRARVGIIDFTDSLIGDPAKDFEVFFDYGPEVAQDAYERYEGPKDDYFLRRAEMYHKTHGIYTLLSTFHGARLSFDWARESFRRRFQL